MVLAQRVGRQRGFGAGLFLTVITVGIYAAYWHYRTHNEVYRQFELAREQRDEGVVWLVLGLLLPPVLLGYLWVFADNVQYVRDRIGLPRRLTPARFVTLVGVAMGLLLAGLLSIEFIVAAMGEGATQEEVDDVLVTVLPVFLVAALGSLVILAYAYKRLQEEVNELWAAYDARVAYLRANPLPPAQVVVSNPAFTGLHGTPRYYADLSPVAAAPLAPPAPLPPARLQEEWERVKAQEPSLLVAGELDGLLSAALLGNVEAHLRAAGLLQATASLLEERRDILRRRERALMEMEGLETRYEARHVDEPTYDAERAVLEREWDALKLRLDAVDERLYGRP